MTLTSNPAPGNPRRVLLAGATGLVGSALERRLRAAHWPLARLLRGPLPDHADAGDLRLPAAPAAADGDAAFVAGLQAFRPAVLVSALGTTLRRAR